MAIRTAADIHFRRHDPLPPTPVATQGEYRLAHSQWRARAGGTVLPSLQQPDVYVEGWKWVVTCPNCDNRPVLGWAIACCFESGHVYEGLVLPNEAEEIERILALRPKLSQRNWLVGETLEQLQAENTELGVST